MQISTRHTILGTVVGARIAGGFVHLTVAEVGQAAPVQVKVGMTQSVPVGSSVVLQDCEQVDGRLVASGYVRSTPVATAQAKQQAKLRKYAWSAAS